MFLFKQNFECGLGRDKIFVMTHMINYYNCYLRVNCTVLFKLFTSQTLYLFNLVDNLLKDFIRQIDVKKQCFHVNVRDLEICYQIHKMQNQMQENQSKEDLLFDSS